ncbi:MAG TPA: DUF72 domain-containing protein [Planctomycetota bacterium]|nr:DUF72 domain-containing protein [Planctomycetota bacterium]
MSARGVKTRLWIGTSGYIYKHWKQGVFYPPDLPQKEWFTWYCSRFRTLEVNTTFYRLARPAAVQKWHEQSPPDFRFFVKGSRFITHMKKLTDPPQALKRFFEGIAPLREKLAGVLWQLPENFKINTERLAAFIAEFRRFSDSRLVFEFRNPTWFHPETTALLEQYGAAYCRADQPPFLLELQIPDTASFVYYRRHGPTPGRAYADSYSDAALRSDAGEVRRFLRRGREVYVYFNNDIGGHAPRDAVRLQSFSAA